MATALLTLSNAGDGALTHRSLAKWYRGHMRRNALSFRSWADYETKQASEASRLVCQEYAIDNFNRALTNRDKALHHERQ